MSQFGRFNFLIKLIYGLGKIINTLNGRKKLIYNFLAILGESGYKTLKGLSTGKLNLFF